MGLYGNVSNLLPHYYSEQFKNYRDVPVYVPPTVLQNYLRRPVDVMLILDGAESSIQSYAFGGGFESGQMQGVVPESIMIGINQLIDAYAGNSNERTYEFTYEVGLPYPDESCINTTGVQSGGSGIDIFLGRNVFII